MIATMVQMYEISEKDTLFICNSLSNNFLKYLYYKLARFEHYRMIQTTQNFEPFDKKASTIFDKVTPFWKIVFVAQNHFLC